MIYRPILFSGEMVRGILDAAKLSKWLEKQAAPTFLYGIGLEDA